MSKQKRGSYEASYYIPILTKSLITARILQGRQGWSPRIQLLQEQFAIALNILKGTPNSQAFHGRMGSTMVSKKQPCQKVFLTTCLTKS